MLDTFGVDTFVHEQAVEDRSPIVRPHTQGTSRDMDYRLFEGPVFDDMTELSLTAEVLEVDWFPRWGVDEWAADIHEQVILISRQVPIETGTLSFENERARGTIEVVVEQIYDPG